MLPLTEGEIRDPCLWDPYLKEQRGSIRLGAPSVYSISSVLSDLHVFHGEGDFPALRLSGFQLCLRGLHGITWAARPQLPLCRSAEQNPDGKETDR